MPDVANLFPNIALGLETALSPSNLWFCFLGVFLGMFVGVLPGIGALAAISLLFPLTLQLDPTAALIMLAGIHYGSAYGGSISSILLNLPGTASGAVAALDGYPMTKQGRGGAALFLTTLSSFIGGSVAIIIMMVSANSIARIGLTFSSWDYFGLMVLGLVGAATISTGSALKGLAMITIGFLFGLVGRDMNTGIARLNFGILELSDGISLAAMALGLFGVSEIINSAKSLTGAGAAKIGKVTFRSMIPTKEESRKFWGPTTRGTVVGFIAGILPGLGGSVASFMSYAVEVRSAKDPSRFGRGAVEGVVGPEASNNAADQAAFIPTMTLGIPGSPNMALMLAILIIHGIIPGPQMVTENGDMFWGLIMSFWIGNVILVVLNLPLIGLWIRFLQVPYHFLYPAVLVFIAFGAFSASNSMISIWVVIMFGAIGYFLKMLDYPVAPMILGFVLGPLLEVQFRRAMIISRGDLTSIVNYPLASTLMVISAALVLWALWSAFVKNR